MAKLISYGEQLAIIEDLDARALPKEWSLAGPDPAFGVGVSVPAADGSLGSQVLYIVLEPRKSGGRHAHSAAEVLFVLEGSVELTVGDERARLPGRSIAIVPAGVPHEAVNVGQGPLRFLAILPSEVVFQAWEASGLRPHVRTFAALSPGCVPEDFPTMVTGCSAASVQPQRRLPSPASRSYRSMSEMRLRSRPALKRCVVALAGSTC